MLKVIRILLLVSLISMFLTSTALAEGTPVGSCPPNFMLHMAHDHDTHHGDHLHVGNATDKNGDGFICVKPVTPGSTIHVHIDNNVKLGASN